MKVVESKEPISTIPKGVWESSIPYERNEVSQKKHKKEISIDAQGNGYPVDIASQKGETS